MFLRLIENEKDGAISGRGCQLSLACIQDSPFLESSQELCRDSAGKIYTFSRDEKLAVPDLSANESGLKQQMGRLLLVILRGAMPKQRLRMGKS